MATTMFQRVGAFIRTRPQLERNLDWLLRPIERLTKQPTFGCHMCGQCVLHSTGMVCPMTCPKNLRNGPCGGVMQDGSCEVFPEKACIWVTAYSRSRRLPWPEEFHDLRPPVDWALKDSSSWLNLLTARDQVTSGCVSQPDSALDILNEYGK